MQHSTVKTTYVEGGDYFLHDTLNLTAADNGESFLAYQGQTATVHGGHSLSGWTHGANRGWPPPVPPALLHSAAHRQPTLPRRCQPPPRSPPPRPSPPA